MINNLWKNFELIILKYVDVNRQFFSLIGVTIAMIPFLFINYLVFYFVLNFQKDYSHLFLVVMSFGEVRIFLVWLMLKNKKDIGKGHNIFSVLISIIGIGVGVIGLSYLIYKDISGGFEKDKKNELIENNVEIKKEIDVLEKYR